MEKKEKKFHKVTKITRYQTHAKSDCAKFRKLCMKHPTGITLTPDRSANSFKFLLSMRIVYSCVLDIQF